MNKNDHGLNGLNGFYYGIIQKVFSTENDGWPDDILGHVDDRNGHRVCMPQRLAQCSYEWTLGFYRLAKLSDECPHDYGW
jgi:hypothetical protein